MLYQF